MKRSCAQRGTGDMGPAITRADGEMLPRQTQRRGRDDLSICGQFTVARTCERTPGEPGIFPLDAPGNRPERCASSCRPAWITLCAVEHPFQDSAGLFEPLLDRECTNTDAERRESMHRRLWVVRLDGALDLGNLATKLCKQWRRVTCVLGMMPVVGDLWGAANAWWGEGAPRGNRWVRAKLTEVRRGRG